MYFTFDVIAAITGLFVWGVMAFFAYRMYKKQRLKPKVWKIVIVIWIGLFSFSINWTMFDTLIKFPILPLGVWILYLVLKGKEGRWETYRAFAWLGFWANFLFLASTLLAVPLHHLVYPKDEPTTYLSSIENASINAIHPSAKERALDRESLVKQLDSMKQATIFSDQWYEDTYMNTESDNKKERFPYQLIGTSPKWGSGLHMIIYVEENGKGLLLSTPKRQLYFQTEDTLLIVGVDEQ